MKPRLLFFVLCFFPSCFSSSSRQYYLNRTRLIFPLLISIIINSNIIAQWELRYPDIPADLINSLVFTSELKGYFVNEGGDVIQTEDGGLTWTIKKFLPDQNLNEIKFIDAQNGFAYAVSNIHHTGHIPLIFTNDGGITWNESQVALWGALTFLPVSSTMMIQADRSSIKTLNNFYGNWLTTYSIPTFIMHDTLYQWEELYGNIFEFELLDNGEILAIGNSWIAKTYNQITDSVSFILKSTDNGESWDTLWCNYPYELKTISFANENTGWMGGEQKRIYKTTDAGLNWFLQLADTVSPFPGAVEQIFAVNETNIYASLLGGFLRSTDGGNSWHSGSYPGYNSLKLFFVNPLKGFAYGTDLLKTTDGGINWSRVSKSIKDDIIKVDFQSTSKGWALGYNKLYNTTDGGYSWAQQFTYEGGGYDHWGLKFIDSLKGYIIGYLAAYETSDGGNTWDSIITGNNSTFFGGDVDYYNDELGILCNLVAETVPGSHIYDISGIMITTDSGLTWTPKMYPANSDYGSFHKIRFLDPEHIYAINMKGLWLSSDTARSWQLISDESYFLGSSSFDFINSWTGCYGDVTALKITEDYGQSWQNLQLSKHFRVRDYQVIDKDIFGNLRIFGAGDAGRIMKYSYGYYNSDSYPLTYTASDLKSLSLYMDKLKPHIWAGGEGFTILYGTTELVSAADEYQNNIVTDFSLQQNFPNPFNPDTKISYQLPVAGLVSLKIYDLLGNEIATLKDEYETAGRYDVVFNASGLPSGVYFYQLKAGENLATKKMLLIK